jgi:hypothetical protein
MTYVHLGQQHARPVQVFAADRGTQREGSRSAGAGATGSTLVGKRGVGKDDDYPRKESGEA